LVRDRPAAIAILLHEAAHLIHGDIAIWTIIAPVSRTLGILFFINTSIATALFCLTAVVAPAVALATSMSSIKLLALNYVALRTCRTAHGMRFVSEHLADIFTIREMGESRSLRHAVVTYTHYASSSSNIAEPSTRIKLIDACDRLRRGEIPGKLFYFDEYIEPACRLKVIDACQHMIDNDPNARVGGFVRIDSG
jgi:hypothetical protein